MLTLEEKIARSERFAELCAQAVIPEWQEECEQLVEWLRELQETRKERDYWKEKANSYEQTIFKLTDSISKQPEIIRYGECKHWKDSDGVYRRGINAESKCPVNSRQVYEGTFFCGMAERRTDGEETDRKTNYFKATDIHLQSRSD